MKKKWGNEVITIFPQQGHYASDPKILDMYPPADISIGRIGELLVYDLQALRAAGDSTDMRAALA